ncbi:transmembrane protein 59-like [Callorhinchus milii]|uniref:Transmembrane protein 59-like n=1 Tax=Callorhinchus milii TaxID=7868 RepID=A0A4W3H867_CALMI|nr:transmembrane protein 59-like [Callorhinchus milii]|eukprot:gi/632961998/ref/XP_007897068.1/ PREDICTED: transmembrane protein 59-like [Callorhinchus milii]
MAAVTGIFSPLLAVLWVTSSGSHPTTDPFAILLGDTARCQGRCHHTFAQQGQPREATLNACQRGCRLFSICLFVDGASGLNNTRAECEAACLEAYAQRGEQRGCNTGCREQFLEEEKRQKQLQIATPKEHAPSIFDYISNLCSDIVSSAQSFISSTWTFYLQADDGKVVVFQAQPDIEYPAEELQAPRSNVAENIPKEDPSEAEENWPKLVSATLSPRAAAPEAIEKSSKEEQELKRMFVHPEEPHSEHDFLGCMSRRSGLPRWILAACLVLSILVMLWLSCASLVTAQDQHVKSQLSINGDEDYLDSVTKGTSYTLAPVLAVRVGDMDSEDAGPLPMKVDLNKTLI